MTDPPAAIAIQNAKGYQTIGSTERGHALAPRDMLYTSYSTAGGVCVTTVHLFTDPTAAG
jgi:hypothetical protein